MSRWRCRRYRTLLVDYVDGQLPPLPRRRLEQHMAACAACTQALAALQQLPALLRTCAVPDPGEEFWRQQRHAIARAIRNAPAPQAAWRPAWWREGWRPGLWRYPVGAAAALLLGLLVYHSARREQPALPGAAAEAELAALDAESLVTLHDIMQALVPAYEAPRAVSPEDETVLAALPLGDYVSGGTDPEVPQANDLSDNELEGLDTLVGDFG